MNIRIYPFALMSLLACSAFAQTATPPMATFPVSTAPSNGDQNPYGVAFVPDGIPVNGIQGVTAICSPGDILISNFNNATNNTTTPPTGNLQGLGTTITRIQSTGITSTFFQTPASMAALPGHPGQGLTNALAVLPNGMVIAGSLPTTDGTFATVGAGSLLFIRRDGVLSQTITYQPAGTSGQVISSTAQGFVTSAFFPGYPNIIDGPWSMSVSSSSNEAFVFVSNVLAGSVVRFHLSFDSDGDGVAFDAPPVTVVSGLNHQNDANLFLTGPSGLFYDGTFSATQDTLFIANSKDDAIYQLQGATWNGGPTQPQLLTVDFTHLSGPLGLAMSPTGNIYVANSDGNPLSGGPTLTSAISIYNLQGQFQGWFSVDPNFGGAFGIAFYTTPTFTLLRPTGNKNVPYATTTVTRFGAVNDNKVVFNLWNLYFN
jgi:hypothetical protein